MELLKISKEYLDEVSDKWISALVGKIMKRFEIHSDKNTIKKEVKELLYENIRELKLNIRSFSYGVKFTKNKPTEKDQ